jgi:hypothetical protein
MARDISNRENMLDSRDIIARIDDLRDELEAEHEAIGGPGSDTLFDTWLQETAEDSAHTLQEAASELRALLRLADECEGYGDWAHGEGLIRESYFKDYAQEMAEDMGAIDRNAQWPLNFIDWDAAADALRQDYMEVDYDGVTYLMRA